MKLIDDSIKRLSQALDIRATRHGLITSNISNQDTPGFKSKEIDFKQAMADAAAGPPSTLRMIQTNAGHLPASQAPATSAPRVTLSSHNGAKRLDGNTVNPEKEMTRLAENTFMYQATAQFIAKKFKGIKNAINEGR